MIKRILVATDGSDVSQKAVDYALSLAQELDARVTGVYVVDVKLLEGPYLRDLSATAGATPYMAYQGEIARMLDERGRAVLTRLEAQMAEAGIEGSTELLTGVVHHAVSEHAGTADLLVLGRAGEHSDWLEGLMGSTAEAVVRRATLPVVVTTCTRPMAQGILLAFDGSPYAKQALKFAAALATESGAALNVLFVGESPDDIVAEAQTYLRDHELKADIIVRAGEAGPKIVEYVDETQPGILVMGAYGHSRVRELLIGSTTTYVLNRAACPVLLSR